MLGSRVCDSHIHSKEEEASCKLAVPARRRSTSLGFCSWFDDANAFLSMDRSCGGGILWVLRKG